MDFPDRVSTTSYIIKFEFCLFDEAVHLKEAKAQVPESFVL